MNKKRSHSLVGQVVLFMVLSLLFSALPFLFGLLLDKSSLVLGVITAWYALFPPTIILLLAWLLYRGERNWLIFMGRLWVSLGFWFGLQSLLTALSGVHIFVLLFALPTTLAGNQGYIPGTAIFLLGGIMLWLVGGRLALARPATPNRRVSALAGAILLALIFLGIPLLVGLTSASTTASPTAGADLPTTDEVFGYVADIYEMGIRRPGWPAAEQARDYLVASLQAFGFDEVHVEPTKFDLWKENAWGLTVAPGTANAWEPDSYFVPYSGSTGPQGVTAEVIYVGEGSQEELAQVDLAGKILLASLPPTDITWDQMKLFTFMAYDPDNTVPGWGHPYPIGWLPRVETLQETAVEHGAVGMIGVLRGYPEMGEFGYYAPYNGVIKDIPGLYLLEDDGQRLTELVEAGTVEAQFLLDANVSQDREAWIVYAVLPGQREDVIMFHTHYDAPWNSGIEDSSGVGMVLGLARYYAQMPQEERQYTLVFIFMGSHMVGAPTNFAFMEQHQDDIMSNLLVDICIEHIADDYNPPDPPTGYPEPRGNFIAESPILVSHFAGAVADHGADRMLIFPTGTILGVPTDAGMFARSGYQVSSLISGPVWLFDDDDTLERVAKEELGPLSAMYVDYIERLDRFPPAMLRFNLNIWTLIVSLVVFTPLATLNTIHRTKSPSN